MEDGLTQMLDVFSKNKGFDTFKKYGKQQDPEELLSKYLSKVDEEMTATDHSLLAQKNFEQMLIEELHCPW